MKTYIVGDLHGCYDEFIELTTNIGISDDDLMISVGDIVDRGNKSVELYHYFRDRKNAVVLMGNHERKHLNGILNYAQEIVKLQFGTEYQGFLDWIKTLPYYYETPEAIIVHAFFEHDKQIQAQKEEVLAGTTAGSKYLENKYEEGKFWTDYYTGNKAIIYGHHVVGDEVKIHNNTYGIDTAACHAGNLTIIELPAFKVHQIKVQTDHWKIEREKWQIPVLKAKNWKNMSINQIYKQIDKLSYKEGVEINKFFSELKIWMSDIEELFFKIESSLKEITSNLKEKHGDNLKKEVVKLSYRTFVFAVISNHLDIEFLKKKLVTPNSVMELSLELGIGFSENNIN